MKHLLCLMLLLLAGCGHGPWYDLSTPRPKATFEDYAQLHRAYEKGLNYRRFILIEGD